MSYGIDENTKHEQISLEAQTAHMARWCNQLASNLDCIKDKKTKTIIHDFLLLASESLEKANVGVKMELDPDNVALVFIEAAQ